MEHKAPESKVLYADDDIDALGLSMRPHNALKRADIDTIGQVHHALESGQLQNVKNRPQGTIEFQTELPHFPNNSLSVLQMHQALAAQLFEKVAFYYRQRLLLKEKLQKLWNQDAV